MANISSRILFTTLNGIPRLSSMHRMISSMEIPVCNLSINPLYNAESKISDQVLPYVAAVRSNTGIDRPISGVEGKLLGASVQRQFHSIPRRNYSAGSSAQDTKIHDIMLPSKVEKVVHNKKISELLQKYPQVFVCLADNVACNQLQAIRRHLRPDSVILMGKNTVMKRTMERYGGKSENTSYENMVPLLVGNVALIFTRGNLREVCEKGALITKFGTRPLSRGLIVKAIYGGGSVFDPTILDLIEDDSVEKASAGISLWQPFFWLSTVLQ